MPDERHSWAVATKAVRWRWVLPLALVLGGCYGDEGCDLPTSPPSEPQECATLSARTDWSIGRAVTDLRLPVGHSEWKCLWPSVESQCEEEVTSVIWASDNPELATVEPMWGAGRAPLPDPECAWVTGIARGITRIHARIGFRDGIVRNAAPRDIDVVPSTGPPAGSVLVTEGTVEVDAPVSHPGQTSEFVPFTFPARGRADMKLDWTSLHNGMDFVLFEGSCLTQPCPGRLVLTSGAFGEKPIFMSHSDLAAGKHTLRIDNTGPGPETARYEVRHTAP